MRRTPLAALVGITLAVLPLTGCSGSDTTAPSSSSVTSTSTSTSTAAPSAAELISRSSTAVKAVRSAHFVVTVTGELPDLLVQSAEGDLTKAGEAQGMASIKQFGQLVEVEFVVVNKDLYLKAATGGFTKLPAALAGQVYDPTAILDPTKGVAAVLTSATGLSAVTSSGDSDVVSGTVPKAVAAGLTPGITSDVVGTFTVDTTTSLPSSVSFAVPAAGGTTATVALALSDFDEDVTITAPTGS